MLNEGRKTKTELKPVRTLNSEQQDSETCILAQSD